MPIATARRWRERVEAFGGAALQLKGMIHDDWFQNYISCFHANERSYVEVTKIFSKGIDENQCEAWCDKTSNTLHVWKGTMKQRSFHLSRGGVNREDGLLEARPPLYEGNSSICEV